jgi:precorrin-2 dehydrogenase/sirohydrochlorin ferrochelatase
MLSESKSAAANQGIKEEHQVKYYPIYVVSEGKPCAVYGGGEEASLKVRGMLTAGAKVTLIEPELTNDYLREQARDGVIEYRAEAYDPDQLEEFSLVIVARDDTSTNELIATDARERGVLVNAADDTPNCDFILPSIVREGDLTIAISTAGKSPAIARRLREELTDYLGGEFPALLDVAGEVRTTVRAAKRMPSNEIWQASITPELRALCVKGRLDEAKGLMFANLGLADLWKEEAVVNG